MKNTQPQWIRVAGDSINIKNNKPDHWQAYLEDSTEKIPIKKWKVIGKATEKNYIPNASFERDFRGLLAWIDVYGTFEISRDKVATITLENI